MGQHARRNAILLLLLTGTLWSSSGLFIKLLSWEPFAILSGRSFIAGVVLWLYLGRVRMPRSHWQFVAAIAYVTTQLLFITATKLTTAANAIFLQFTAPIYVVFFGYWFLREKPQRADWVSMPLIFIGMALFFGDNLNFDGFVGNVLAIISGVTMALMIVGIRHQKEANPANAILIGNLLGGLVGLPFLLQATFQPVDISIILYLGLIQIGLSMIIYTNAIKYVPALESTLIVTIEPILNPVWVFLVLGEIPGPLAMIGGLIVIGVITARAVLSTRAKAEEVNPAPLVQ